MATSRVLSTIKRGTSCIAIINNIAVFFLAFFCCFFVSISLVLMSVALARVFFALARGFVLGVGRPCKKRAIGDEGSRSTAWV